MSFTFHILDPVPHSLLNNTCGAQCGDLHICFPIGLDNLVFSEVLLST